MATTVKHPEITQEQVEFYHENGYLALEKALNAEEIEELLQEATKICRGETGNFFGVENVNGNESDNDVLRKYLCIHYPHKISETMRKYLGHPVIANTLAKLIGPDVKCM